MKKLTSICTACLFVSGVVSAQQPHVHGEGKLLVGQEGQTWELMFEIPAANALGFEYLPTNDAEIAKIEAYIEAVQNNTGLVDAGDSCRLQGVEHTIGDVFFNELNEHGHDEHDHDEHQHDEQNHDEHEHEHEHDEHEHSEHDHNEHEHDEHDHDKHDHEAHDYKGHGAHYSVNFTLSFNCDNDSSEFIINVFDNAFDLNELNTEWFTEDGQGATTLTPSSRTLSFDN